MRFLFNCARIVLKILRLCVFVGLLWVIFELIYYHYTGDYWLYNGFYLRSAQNLAQQIYVVNDVYNVRSDMLSIRLSSYFIPAIAVISALVATVDLIRLMESLYSRFRASIAILTLAEVVVSIMLFLIAF